MNTMTTTAVAWLWVLTKAAEQAVKIIYVLSIPAHDQSHNVRRPSLSTASDPPIAAKKLKICKMPLIKVLVKESVMPTVSRTSDR